MSDRQKVKEILCNYLLNLHNITDSDCYLEVGNLVDDIINLAAEEAVKKINKERDAFFKELLENKEHPSSQG